MHSREHMQFSFHWQTFDLKLCCIFICANYLIISIKKKLYFIDLNADVQNEMNVIEKLFI